MIHDLKRQGPLSSLLARRLAADKFGEDPDQLSFAHAQHAMPRGIINPGASPPKRQPDDIIEKFLEERFVSSHREVKPRSVWRKVRGLFHIRRRGLASRRRPDWNPVVGRIALDATAIIIQSATLVARRSLTCPARRPWVYTNW